MTTSNILFRRLFCPTAAAGRLCTGWRTAASRRAYTYSAAIYHRHPWGSRRTVALLPARRLFSTAGCLRDEVKSGATSTNGVQPPEHLNELEAGIYVKLAEKLSPTRLDVRDISGGCGSMYAVEIESPLFRGLTTLKMHRRVQDVLAEEIKGWHGIQLKTKATPVDT
ncbi:hypothetical protein TWF696_008297 [Orbilia brochopaga]|uniref:Bola-like protein n=1 Tax=Orbilia brochopaga TaxID=3140254 RepID=A0AAV9UGC1_9PEZI